MLNFKIVTPEGIVYQDEIAQATIPTMDGEITILPDHVPLVSILKTGELRVKDKEGEHVMALAGGFLEMRGNNELVLLADNAERAEHIDVDRAEQARKRAEELMKQAENVADVDFAKLQAMIDREMNRLRVARKYRDVGKI